MKTSLIPSSDIAPNPPSQNPRVLRFASLGRILLATLSVSLVTLVASPLAHAGKVDGKYEVKRATGSVTFDGNEVDIPKSIVKRLVGVAKGDITINNKSLRLKKKAAIRFAEELGEELNLDVEASVTGPSSVTLEKNGKVFSGWTTRPIVADFEAGAFGVNVSGKLKTRVYARVLGKKLKVIVKFSGSGAGSDVSGRVIIIAKR